MKRIARTLEVSLAVNSQSCSNEVRQERATEIAAMPTGPQKALVSGLERLTKEHRDVAVKSLSGLSRMLGGLSYLGNGAFASVYRHGSEVIKVYRHTAVLDEGTRAGFREERQRMCDTLHAEMGTMVAAQTVTIGRHPFGDYDVVLGHQPYVPGGHLDLFKSNSLKLKSDAISDYCERQPGGQSQLAELARSVFRGHDSSGLIPDLNGNDNFRLVGQREELCLIDAEPISCTEFPGPYDLILRQAEVLADFVEAA